MTSYYLTLRCQCETAVRVYRYAKTPLNCTVCDKRLYQTTGGQIRPCVRIEQNPAAEPT